jgi:four helix bundle protein
VGPARRHQETSTAFGGKVNGGFLMTSNSKFPQDALPHHRLRAYGAAVELLVAVRAAKVRDAGLRDQALRSAKSACLNVAEGAGRVSRADKARVFAIARAEAGEAAAAVEIAALSGDAEDAAPVLAAANAVVAMLTGLIRP